MKKILAILMTMSMILNMSIASFANTVTESSTGDYGRMTYTLKTNLLTNTSGATTYALSASATQNADASGNYMVISSIQFKATFYLRSGGSSEVTSGNFTSKDASWTTSGQAASLITTNSRKGNVLHMVRSQHYGNISRVVENV